MPLRDHFRKPLTGPRSWEGFHNAWPTMIVMRLPLWIADNYSIPLELEPSYEETRQILRIP